MRKIRYRLGPTISVNHSSVICSSSVREPCRLLSECKRGTFNDNNSCRYFSSSTSNNINKTNNACVSLATQNKFSCICVSEPRREMCTRSDAQQIRSCSLNSHLTANSIITTTAHKNTKNKGSMLRYSVHCVAQRYQSSSAKKDLYSVLGIARNATPEQIKAAYKKRAKTLHPDVNPSPRAAEDFAEAKQAYETLSDPQKRSMYDMTGNAGQANNFNGFPNAAGFNPFGQAANGAGGANPFGAAGNPFANMGNAGANGGFSFNDFEEIFQKMSGANKEKTRKAQGPEPGADIHYKLKLGFLEAVNGCHKEISFNTMRRCGACTGSGYTDAGAHSKCPHCGGRGKKVMSTGFFHMQQDCTHCGGTGEVGRSTCAQCSGKGIVKDRSVQTLPVPKGVNNKERLKVSGKGEAGMRNGPPGNLYVEITVEEHPVFHREGSDIHVVSPITLSTAVLGGSVRVPTLTGEVETRVPVGTQQGDKLVLRGRGVHRPNQNRTGDFYIHFAVLLPKQLTEEQKKAIAEFAKDEKPIELSDGQLHELKNRYLSWFTA